MEIKKRTRKAWVANEPNDQTKLPAEAVSRLLGYTPKVIFEFGTFNGEDARLYKNTYPTCKVLAFEASPSLFEKIEKTEGIEYFNNAILNYDGDTTFYKVFSKNEGKEEFPNGGVLKVTDEVIERITCLEFNTNSVTVPCKRIDTICKEQSISEIDFAHIDVEGVSKEVIEGFGNFKPKLIFVELFLTEESHIGGSKGKEVCQILEDMGYSFIDTNGNDVVYQLKG